MKRFLLLVSLAFSAVFCLVAQNAEISLPATFVYKKASDGLTTGIYALSGTNEKGAELFLTSNFYNKTKKLLGESFNSSGGRITVENESLLWKIELTLNGTYKLFSVKEQKYLTAKSGAMELSFDKKGTEWYASYTEQGNLILRTEENSNRQLAVAVNYNEANVSYFDNYTSMADKNVALGLKVYQPTFSYISGPNTQPKNGARLCIGSTALLRLTDGSGSPLSGALLKDGTLAPLDDLPVYTAAVGGDGTFSLRGKSGCLDYNLQETAAESLWQITNGHLCTTEGTPRYLCYQDGAWKLCDEQTAKTDAWLYAVADEPQYTIDEKGVCTLTGGWSVERIAAFTADNVRCLDLTQAALPATLKSFTALPANVPVFASSDYKDGIGQTKRIAIVCGSENEMVNVTYTLTDRQSFYTDRRFKVGANQLNYRRGDMPTDKWQTLSLPFPAKVENGRAFAYTGTSDGAMQFEETTAIEANKGYIILPSAMGTFTAASQEGYAECTESSEAFKGTCDTLNITQGYTPVYLLHPTAQCFRQAAAGSTLPPFRAYFQSASQRALRVRLNGF